MGMISLRQAAAWCGGTVAPQYEDVTFFGASNDSRSVASGQLFIALEGVRDGHDFIPMAMEKGAAAVLCSRSVGDYPAIIVDDPRKALGDIARGHRQQLDMKVVGVTGSVGKSTTKEMIAAVLESTYRVGKTPVNHNNDIGMPMAILAMPEDTQVAVLEMGMNHFREIAYLSNIARPDVGVIVNIGTMHIEHLGSREGILKAKLEILEGMVPDGCLLLNGDDSYLCSARDKLPLKSVYFGMDKNCAVRGEALHEDAESLNFRVATEEDDAFSVTLPLVGRHYVTDALAAVGVGLQLGVSPEKIASQLAKFQNMDGRQQILRVGGYTLINDCYNAGPESMAASLAVLGNRPGRHIAVLGDMLELGDRAPQEHYWIGTIAAVKADRILAYGPNARQVIRGAVESGMAADHAMAFEDKAAMAAMLRRMATPGDSILFKGSRGMRMEQVLQEFLKEEA